MGELALFKLDVADPFVKLSKKALPAHIAGIGLGKVVDDRESGLVVFEGLDEFAAFSLDFADIQVTHRKIALPVRVAGIGLGEAVGDCEAGAVGVKGLREAGLIEVEVLRSLRQVSLDFADLQVRQ